MTRIVLVRHGQSEWNALGRWQGWADPPLTPLGREQAHRAVAAIGAVDAVVSSDLRRALDTATIVAAERGLAPPAVVPALRERDVGEWTGLTREEIERRWPGALDGGFPEPPGGESRAALVQRMLGIVAQLAETYADQDVLAVSHGGSIRSLERHLGVEPQAVPNLGGVELTVGAGGLAVGPRRLYLDPDEVLVTVPRQL